MAANVNWQICSSKIPHAYTWFMFCFLASDMSSGKLLAKLVEFG